MSWETGQCTQCDCGMQGDFVRNSWSVLQTKHAYEYPDCLQACMFLRPTLDSERLVLQGEQEALWVQSNSSGANLHHAPSTCPPLVHCCIPCTEPKSQSPTVRLTCTSTAALASAVLRPGRSPETKSVTSQKVAGQHGLHTEP